MHSIDQARFASFLTTCSKVSLSDFLLAKQNRAANLEKQLCELSGELSENLVLIELANLIRSPQSKICSITKGQGAAELSTSPKPYSPNFWRFAGHRRDLSKNEKMTFLGIKALCNEEGIGALTKERIANWCSSSISSVKRGLRGLRTKGFVRTQKRKWDMLVFVLEPPPERIQEGSQRPLSRVQEGSHRPVSTAQEGSHRPPSTYVIPVGPKPGAVFERGSRVDDSRRPIEAVLTDDGLLSDFLFMKFRPDTERFPALNLEHVQFAIRIIRERASAPPGSVRYWMIAMEKFLVDFAGEWKSAEQKALIEKELRIGSGPVVSHQHHKRKAAG